MMLASGFFPYLPGGLRVEHLIFPLIFILATMFSIDRLRTVSKPLLFIACLLFSAALFALIGSYFSASAGVAAPVLSMSIRLLFPAIVIATLAVSIPANSCVMRGTATAVVMLAMPLALIAISSVFFDISDFLYLYVKSEEDSVWSQASAVGRFTGLFNQPLEAGIFYSVSLLALIYLMSIKWWRPSGRVLFLGLILVGGSLSISKNFVVLGVLTSLIYSVSISLISTRSAVILLGAMVAAVSSWLMLSDDNYSNSFIQLYSDGGFLMALTAGRLGSGDTEVAQLWSQLFSSGKWIGGAGLGSHLPLDNGYLEYFYQGGIFSVGCYLLAVFSVLIYSIVNWSINESKLLFFLGIFVVLSSLGGPAITANRANVPLLALMAACVLSISYCNKQINRSEK
jgi:hypothetical protein